MSPVSFLPSRDVKGAAWKMHRGRHRGGGACGRGGSAVSSGQRSTLKSAADAVVAALFFVASSSMPIASAQQQQQQQPQQQEKQQQTDHQRQNRSVTVRDAGSLRAALDDGSVSEILLAEAGRDIDLDGAAAFPIAGPPAVIGPGRTLVVRSADSTTPASLNFSGGPTPAILVARDAALVFSQLLLTSAKPPSSAEAGKPP